MFSLQETLKNIISSDLYWTFKSKFISSSVTFYLFDRNRFANKMYRLTRFQISKKNSVVCLKNLIGTFIEHLARA